MIFTTAVISDIHFGAIRPEILYDELQSEFLNFINNHYVDMVVICGDFFNSIIALNSHSALAAFKFMDELIKICEEKEIKYVRIIEGTLSHDNFQILNFKMYKNNKKVNFDIITNVSEEYFEKENIRVLYLPEEYIDDVKEYYKPYLDKPKKYYDFIFGHGMFKETSFIKDEGESEISKAPIWDSKLLVSLSKGPIFFGHIHTAQVIRKHIYYTGSFSRWVHGQEEDKGFMIFVYDTNSFKYLTEFIKNKKAKKYETLTLLYNHENDFNAEKIISLSKQIKDENVVDNFRLLIIIEALDRDISYDLAYLKEWFTGRKGYKLEIVDKREKVKKEQIEEKVSRLLTEYNFIFDKNLPLKTKIHKFIKRKYKKEISEEIIESVLNTGETK